MRRALAGSQAAVSGADGGMSGVGLLPGSIDVPAGPVNRVLRQCLGEEALRPVPGAGSGHFFSGLGRFVSVFWRARVVTAV